MRTISCKPAMPASTSMKRILLLCTMFLFAVLFSCNNDKTPAEPPLKDSSAITTPAADGTPVLDTSNLMVATPPTVKSGKDMQVIFDQRQSFFTLLGSNRNYSTILKALQDGYSKKKWVRVVSDNKTYNIENILPISSDVLDSLAMADKNVKSEPGLSALTKFDSVAINKPKVRALVGCTSPVTITQANQLFALCVAQACTSPSPSYPCIPFQYVRDGCYARAHKMAAIIGAAGYCVNKVFSFANQGTDQLAVKVGNCCVTWWYHVAPLIVVRISNVNYSYVIDPGMFNAPVPLATWLTAQANNCSSRARVTSYNITDPSMYTPANYAGTLFNTDPNYVNTNYTLNYYRYFVTCP